MKHKKTVIALLAVLAVIAIIIFAITGKNSQEPVDPGPAGNENPIVENTGFKVIDFGDRENETMVGKLDEIDKVIRESEQKYIEYLALTETDLVHPVTNHKIFEDKNGFQYVFSGNAIYSVEGEAITYGENGDCNFLKNEDGKRVRVYCFESEAEMFKNAWLQGQAILKGEVPSEIGQVIIDGALSDITFEKQGDEIYLDLEKMQRWLNPNNKYNWEERALALSITENYTVFLYNTQLEGEFFKGMGGTADGYYILSAPVSDVNVKIPLISTKNPVISLHDFSKVSGAEISTDGKAISIVTSPENVTDETIVFNPEHRPLTIKIQRNSDNSLSYVKLDRFENIVEQWAYDGEDDEMMQTMYPRY